MGHIWVPKRYCPQISPSLSESLQLPAPPFSQLGDVLPRKLLPSVGIKQNLGLRFLYRQGIRVQRTRMGVFKDLIVFI